MAARAKLSVPLDPTARERPRLGHNGGPPLEVTWEAWLWRRAHAQAWKPPSREVALLRIRRAERLGLGYRDYTAALMDRGVHLSAVLFAPDAFDAARAEKLYDCRILVCLAAPAALDAAAQAKADTVEVVPDRQPQHLVSAIDRFLKANRLTPSAAFLVGTEPWHLRAAEDAGLALFKWARDYWTAP